MSRFLNSIDLKKSEIQNARVQNLGSAPSSPVTGQIYYDTVANAILVWNGTAWAPGGVPDATTGVKGIVQLAGDLTGTAASPTIANLAVTAAKIANTTITVGKIDTTSVTLSSIGAPTADVPWNSKRITGLLDPSSAQDAATKNYVDTNGTTNLDWKNSVKVVSTTNGTISTAYANGQTVDGYTLVTGDRILLAAQSPAVNNGIYVVAASGTPSRATDATALTSGAVTYVEGGTANTDTIWRTTNGTNWRSDVNLSDGNGLIWENSSLSLSGNSATSTITISTSSTGWALSGTGLGYGRVPAAAIDLKAATTAAGGIAFGANEFQLYRSGTGILTLNAANGLDMASHKIANVLDPVSAQDAATKNYVDNAINGIDAKPSVLCATTSGLTFGITSGVVTQINGTVVDGQSPQTGDRILIKDAPATTGVGSANSSQPGNGIYTVTNVVTNIAVSRSTDMDGVVTGLAAPQAWNAEIPGAYVWVESGTAYADTGWLCVSDEGSGPINAGNITWSQFSGSAVITAGNGLTKSGNVISALLNGSGITSGLAIAAGGINVAPLGITNAMIAAATIDLTTKVTGTLPVGNGGTGLAASGTSGNILRSNGTSWASASLVTAGIPAKYSVAIGNGSLTSFTVTHNLGTQQVVVSVAATASPFDIVYPDITVATTNTCVLTFAVAPASNEFTVTVIG